MMTLQAPDHIEVEDGHVTALYTQPQFIGPVKRGRPAPQTADKPLVRILRMRKVPFHRLHSHPQP